MARQVNAADAVLVAEEVERRFEAVEALRGVSLSVRCGELFGLIGPDGAGKTTMVRALAGLIGVHGGRVRVLGRDPLRNPVVRDAMGVMPQHYSLYGDLSVIENLRFFGRLFCLPRREFTERSARLLDITRLAPFTDRRADALSGGMYKKLALACALLHRPAVLLLDEPTNGVDPVSRRELWELLHEFVGEGMAVLLSTAYMDEAERCHRVCLLHGGCVIAAGEPRALVRQLEHPVFEVRGGDRVALHALLEGFSGVIAASPAGDRLRVVLVASTVPALTAELGTLGAALAPVTADFEDVFLTRIAAAGDAPRASAAARPLAGPVARGDA
ncbi:MAG: ABC transporter ATP-binding protein [Polyangiaceae bacterium]|nr:ABC transporter ATP-binding protein [Polyangiaceae bacterium]